MPRRSVIFCSSREVLFLAECDDSRLLLQRYPKKYFSKAFLLHDLLLDGRINSAARLAHISTGEGEEVDSDKFSPVSTPTEQTALKSDLQFSLVSSAVPSSARTE